MKAEIFLSFLLLINSTIFFIRGMINWSLLNSQEGTNHPKITNAKPIDLILTIRHLLKSFLKFWWIGSDDRILKILSNSMSTILYLGILIFVGFFVLEYKI